MTPDDGVVEVPLGDSGGSRTMAGLAENLHEQNMSAAGIAASVIGAQLAQTGNIAQNNFVTVQKVIDYDYLENKRMVTLDEAVGVREVSSKEVPAGPANANR